MANLLSFGLYCVQYVGFKGSHSSKMIGSWFYTFRAGDALVQHRVSICVITDTEPPSLVLSYNLCPALLQKSHYHSKAIILTERASSFTVGNNNNAIIPDEQINACLLYQPWCKLHNPKIHNNNNNNNMWVNLIVMSLMTYETLVIILPHSNYL